MSEEGGKVTGIWHIIRLREMLQKWQSNTKAAASSTAKATSPLTGISPAVNERLIRESRHNVSDSEDESCQSPEHPSDVPKGYLAVYVGTELRRFIIPTSYLSLPVFKVLLEKAEEEFGFDPNGALKLPCEIETFKYILQTMKNDSNCLPCNENPSSLEDE